MTRAGSEKAEAVAVQYLDALGHTEPREDCWRNACRLQCLCSLVQRAAQQQGVLHSAVHLRSVQWPIISHRTNARIDQ